MGLWHYKYRFQGMKEGTIRGRNPKRRDHKRRPLPETLKERNIKKRRRRRTLY